MDILPYKEQVVRGRDTKWFRIPSGFQMIQDPSWTYQIEAKIEQYGPSLWIFTLAKNRGEGGKPRNFASYEAALDFWRTWVVRRTTPRY